MYRVIVPRPSVHLGIVLPVLGLLAAADSGMAQAGGAALEPEMAREWFTELDAACAANGGESLWGVEVCGPVLVVDALTRTAIGNVGDEEGLLEEREGVFVGSLPRTQPVANAPVEWAGVRWAMVIAQFMGGELRDRVTILAHESFHRVQPDLDLFTMGEENRHLDQAKGRYWMKLEWDALQRALRAEESPRRHAVGAALTFRAARRAVFPGSATSENAVEIREGLAQYTGLRIAGAGPLEAVGNVQTRRAREDEIVRSFGYNSGPLYGYLLDAADPDWRSSVSGTSDLGALLGEAMGVEPDPTAADGLATTEYEGRWLWAAEEERENLRQQRLDEFRDLLVEGPVLTVDLSAVSSASMDTRAVTPFSESETVYTVRRLVAEWGILQVNGGAVLEDRSARVGRISIAGAAPDLMSGEGWTLELNEGWTIREGERPGDHEVVRVTPPFLDGRVPPLRRRP